MNTENLPDLLSLSPALADRAWRRWLADREPPSGQAGLEAEFVSLAISEWRMNAGTVSEVLSRANLAKRVAAFEASLAAD